MLHKNYEKYFSAVKKLAKISEIGEKQAILGHFQPIFSYFGAISAP